MITKKNVHSQNNFHCDTCGKIFRTKIVLKTHLEIHTKISCPICKLKLANHRMKDHMLAHSSTKELKCNTCGKTFKTRLLRNMHKIEKIQYDICGKTLMNKKFLRTHFRACHIFSSCLFCGKAVSTIFMKRHLKLAHPSGETFLACRIPKCFQKFTDDEGLQEHNQIHIGLFRFKCPDCKHESKTLKDIRRHLKLKHNVSDLV